MSIITKKIRLHNFKRFSDYVIEPNEGTNILIDDNEVGKSSNIKTIDLVSYCNLRCVESLG